MLEALCWTLGGGLSGSIMYIMASDVYKVNMGMIRFCRPITIDRLVNYGFFIGGVLGFFRGYFGMPLIDYLI